VTLNLLSFSLAEGDTLRVFDGDSTDAPLLGAFSGPALPGPVTSSGKYMFVAFNSDDSLAQEGFLASFESEIPVYCSGMTSLSAQADTVSDGSGSYDYHNGSTCTWMINPPGASTVTLYFTEFATEPDFDFLKIYDPTTQQLLAQYSGTFPNGVPDPVTSPSGKVFLAFSTNYTVTYAGWTAWYETDLVKLPEISTEEDISVYPNPAGDAIFIQFKNNPGLRGKTSLIDLNGKVLLTSQIDFDKNIPARIDISSINPGFYFLVIDLDSQSHICRKIAKM
jgi:hypothetical protein